MSNQLSYVYSVQGSGFSSTNLLHTIKTAKSKATKKESAVVLLNGKPYAHVTNKGKLISA